MPGKSEGTRIGSMATSLKAGLNRIRLRFSA